MVIQDIFRTRGDKRSDLTIKWQREATILSIYGLTTGAIVLLAGIWCHDPTMCIVGTSLTVAFASSLIYTFRAYKKEVEYQRTRPIDHSSDTDSYIDNY